MMRCLFLLLLAAVLVLPASAAASPFVRHTTGSDVLFRAATRHGEMAVYDDRIVFFRLAAPPSGDTATVAVEQIMLPPVDSVVADFPQRSVFRQYGGDAREEVLGAFGMLRIYSRSPAPSFSIAMHGNMPVIEADDTAPLRSYLQSLNPGSQMVDMLFAERDARPMSLSIRTVEWGSYFGGQSNDIITSVLPSNDTIFVFGRTSSIDFPRKNALPQDTLRIPTGLMPFVAAFDGAGGLLWSTYVGKQGSSFTYDGLALDSSDGLVIGGGINTLFDNNQNLGDGFPSTPGVLQDLFKGGRTYPPNGSVRGCSYCGDGFLTRLTKDGRLDWSTFLGGSENENITNVVVLPNGDIVAVGATQSADFPLAGAPLQAGIAGQRSDFEAYPFDGFIAVISPRGDILRQSTYYGGIGSDVLLSSAIAPDGRTLFVAGNSTSRELGTPGSYSPEYIGLASDLSTNGLVASIFLPRPDVLWAAYHNHSDADEANARTEVQTISYLPSGRLVFAGQSTAKTMLVTDGAEQKINNSTGAFFDANDGFVAEVSADGSTLRYSSYIGGSNADEIVDIVSFGSGAVLFGQSRSNNFPVRGDVFQDIVSGTGTTSQDGVVVVLDSSLAIVASTYFGGEATDQIAAGTATATGKIVVVGQSNSVNAPFITPGSFQPDIASTTGTVDGFVVVFGLAPPPPPAARITAQGADQVCVDELYTVVLQTENITSGTVTVEWSDGVVQSFAAATTLSVQRTFATPGSYVAVVSASVTNPDGVVQTTRATVSVSAVSAQAIALSLEPPAQTLLGQGDRLQISLTVTLPAASPQAVNTQLRVSVPADILYPFRNTPLGDVESDRRVITILATVPAESLSITIPLDFRVALGTSSSVSIEVWADTTSGVVACRVPPTPTTVTLSLEVCEEGGVRLFAGNAVAFGIYNAYPNPVTGDKLTVEFALLENVPSRLELISGNGQEVFSQDVPFVPNGTIQRLVIPMNTIGNGVYTLRLRNGTQTATRKILVQ